MDFKKLVKGTGVYLKKSKYHPYIGQDTINSFDQSKVTVEELNSHRDNGRGPNVEVDYYFEVQNNDEPMDGLIRAAKMVLEHGTLKPWHDEGDVHIKKPAHYDDNMSWAVDMKLLGYNRIEGVEAGLVTIAYPLEFFDKTIHKFPLSQLMMAIASEPFSAFSFYQGAKIADIRFPDELKSKLPGIRWPHKRILEYLCISKSEPVIGTIVKPKTGLTPELFSKCVVEAALAGAKFTKADENMHLKLNEVPVFVGRTVKDLEKAGFDLGKMSDKPRGTRFLFAPHITAEPDDMMDYARAAVESGANALMFSPYYGGGFQKLAEIADRFDIPIYSHTAGMNVFTGSLNWGIDASIMYRFAAYFGAAFMQLTAVNGYLKPDDVEKTNILEKLRREGLEGRNGMTLVIAGGISAKNIGENIRALGMEGRMFLAGTSVYSHPDGPSAGVKAILLAYRAYCEKGFSKVNELMDFGMSLGQEGKPLVNSLK
ncbi:MAG: RuBisCO large subunit C-terminal-like domain-containing protein [Clostridiales bacterium]|nr:RuBisCO large subunit C-terminal-like domain-containing protein [Clostridiales bacterium]